ncbi:MAG TPA: SCO family protein, partial [Verrucomicrobiae bacterium]
RVVSIFALLFAFLFVGCNKQSTQAPANSANRRVYTLRGVVKEIISPTKAKIQHEAIPGYMEAMTMDFDVKKTNELARIKVGDQIKADMVVTEDDGWLENIVRTGEAPVAVTGDTNQGISFSKSRDVELSVGDPIPDYAFVNEEGKPIRFSDFKGQALGITFIFTRCPFPTFCPRMTSNFEKVAADLAKPGGPTNWHLLSISFDPEYDTPERLAEHAKRFKRDPAKWNFVTSEKAEIKALTDQLGLQFFSRNGTIEHNLRTVIIDASGRIAQIYIGNEWDVDEFIAEMKKASTAGR